MAGHKPWSEIIHKKYLTPTFNNPREKSEVEARNPLLLRNLEDFPDLFFKARTFGVVEDLSRELRMVIAATLDELYKLRGQINEQGSRRD